MEYCCLLWKLLFHNSNEVSMAEKDKIRVLFLCTANAARSQMAAGIVKHDFPDRIETYSAGTNPKGISPLAVMVLAEIGIGAFKYSLSATVKVGSCSCTL